LVTVYGASLNFNIQGYDSTTAVVSTEDVNFHTNPDLLGVTPLYAAVDTCNHRVAEELLVLGAVVNKPLNYDIASPLQVNSVKL